MYRMGQYFRIRYGQDLSSWWSSLYKEIKYCKLSSRAKGTALKFDPTHVNMVSSNKSRTISSAHAFLKGFFPMQKTCDFLKPFRNLSKKEIGKVLDIVSHRISRMQNNRNNLIIVPIRSHVSYNKSIPIDLPFTIFNYFTCPNFSREIDYNNLLNKNSTLLKYYFKNPRLMEILSKNSGYKLDELVINAARLEDAIACDFAENPEYLPDWVKRSMYVDIFKKITHFADLAAVNTIKFNRELQKHVIGVMVNHLISDMKRKIKILASVHKFKNSRFSKQKQIKNIKICTNNDPKNLKICKFRDVSNNPKLDIKIINVYMAHDFTLFALLTYLNIPFSLKPGFGSAFVFELWLDDKLNESNNHIDFSHFTLKLYYKQSDEAELRHIKNVKLIKFIRSFELLDLSKILRYLNSSC
ncbi:uncharacterized protein LOC135929286 [Gordionus sp. m RMFG-2023]|uniref:uncharacterized protein LOC135929286 n=1 Tax=Gordionus sp. m RMFG-2023 TaxID=3053472 RepID=UPI0031FC99D4